MAERPRGALPTMADASRIRTESLLVEGLDAPAAIMSLDMGNAIFLWVGVGSLDLGELLVAAPKGEGRTGTVSNLLEGSRADQSDADAFAAELSRRTGKLVYVSWGLGDSTVPEAHYAVQSGVMKHLGVSS